MDEEEAKKSLRWVAGEVGQIERRSGLGVAPVLECFGAERAPEKSPEKDAESPRRSRCASCNTHFASMAF